jgi:hypothetical protein
MTYIADLQHMPVAGNDWEQWRARIWNQIADGFQGHPGLAPLEQWMRRSHKEKRCIECGDPGTIQQDSIIVASVDSYFLCQPCDTYYREKQS